MRGCRDCWQAATSLAPALSCLTSFPISRDPLISARAAFDAYGMASHSTDYVDPEKAEAKVLGGGKADVGVSVRGLDTDAPEGAVHRAPATRRLASSSSCAYNVVNEQGT